MIFSVLASIFLLGGLTQSAPPPQATINEPCKSIPGLIKTDILALTINTQLNGTIHFISDAKFTANNLTNTLRGAEFINAEEMNRWQLDRRVIVGLPLAVEADNLTKETMEDFLDKVYRAVSTHIIFVQQIISEHEQIDNDRNDIGDLYNQLETKLFRLLCRVNILIESEGVTITNFVDASVIPDSFESENDTVYHMRNYVVGNNVKTFLDSLKSNYLTLLADNDA